MRIQHNIAALNSHRQLGSNNSAVSKNLEKLSSGYRINRAGDDAAGLAISEKMRAQITGLNTASKNAQDGISLVQTAEGALTEVHSMLNRMVELAGQSSNGTYADLVDRENLQKELDSLSTEIDRISKGTNFNGINLLDGNLGGPKMETVAGVKTVAADLGTATTAPAVTVATTPTITGTEGTDSTAAVITIDLGSLSITGDVGDDGAATIGIGGGTVDIDVAAGATMNAAAVAGALVDKTININGVGFKIADAGAGKITLTANDAGALETPTDFDGLTGTVTDGGGTGTVTVTAGGAIAATEITTADGADATSATLKFDTAGMGIAAPATGSKGDKVTFSIAGEDIELDLKNAMDDKAIAAALVGQEITVDGKVFVGALDTAGGTGLTFTAKTAAVTTGVATAGTNGALAATTAGGATGATDAVTGSAATFSMDFTGRTGENMIGGSFKIGNDTFKFVEAGSAEAGDTDAIAIAKNATDADIANAIVAKGAVGGYTPTNVLGKVTFTENAGADAAGAPTFSGNATPKVAFSGMGLSLQIGDTSDSFNQLSVSINSMSAASLGIDETKIDISTQSGAKAAVQKIKDAINTVSSVRGDLGAIQNRLDHTINNLGVTAENMTAAESRIRDVDMAQEMMNFTKNNILTQASQSMLAQANQLPQGVLQLLQ